MFVESTLWETHAVCTCDGMKRSQRVVHPAFPKNIFCCHFRELSRVAVDNTKHILVSLSDTRFDYRFSVDKTLWKNRLHQKKEELYYYAICSKISNSSTKKEVFVEYAIKNVCSFSFVF